MLVKFFAYYRDKEYAGCKAMQMPAPCDILALLVECCEKWPALRPKLLDADGTGIGPDAIVMVNGRNVEHLQGVTTPLADEDTVALFPLVAGG